MEFIVDNKIDHQLITIKISKAQQIYLNFRLKRENRFIIEKLNAEFTENSFSVRLDKNRKGNRLARLVIKNEYIKIN